MKEYAQVINEGGGRATVRIQKKTECGSCNICSFKRKQDFIDIKASNAIGAKAGDKVELKISPREKYESAIIIYLIPLIFAAAGLFVGKMLGGEIIMFVCCLAFLIGGYILVRYIDGRLSRLKGYIPEIIQIIDEERKADE